ncbi:hypothetical protein GCK72_016095 [Caenorhabditis remanei]|uniref:Uncharacterized protein n=1 Tax=Caenorhabditis remanei TaxID=31234 RepID=A0A6A5GVX0_CAERE|nr:hypothetical protein GCK72_016095 [Caenorhabditis remanei]KAF1759628.1 hypothetical protein GCK72_016095 [Caenorhabditis remanei]
MDDESALLGEPETPEMEQKRVFNIMESLAAGEHVVVTERDVDIVEMTLLKIRENLTIAKASILTEEDILNVANLNFMSPNPTKTTASSEFKLSPQSAQDEEILDYEESIDGMETDGELPKSPENSRKSEEMSPKPTKNRQMKRKSSEKSAKFMNSGVKLVADVIYLSSDSSDSESSIPEVRVMKKKRSKIVWDEVKEEFKTDDEVTADEEEDDTNKSSADFLKKLTKEQNYLKLRKSSSLSVDSKKVGMTYPLGVTYDDPSSTWFITNTPYHLDGIGGEDNGESKILKIYTGRDQRRPQYSDIEGPGIENPSAICVYKEGSQIAVLCSDNKKYPSIRIINHKRDDKISTYCSWKNEEIDFSHPARGLARTKAGNLLTTDRPFNKFPRLRIFSKRSYKVVEKSFDLIHADIPSFVASSGDTVVVTDLGQVQTVTLIKLDDSKWKNIKFQVLKVIQTMGVNLRAEEMLDQKYFLYVSGAQIDRNGNVIIADAKNHHFKLFKPAPAAMTFVSRVATDFPVPYVSSFHVNKKGECLILSTRESSKIHFAKLTSTNRLERHIKSGSGGRIGVKNPLSSKRLTYRNGV